MKAFLFFIIFLIFMFTNTIIFSSDYYRSNSIGMIFEKISSFRIDDFTWVIKLSKAGSLETRIIYYNGEENKKLEYFTEDNVLVISEYVLDELVRTEKYINGLIVKEEYYEEGKLINTFIYEWSGQQLQKTTYIENDIPVYDDLFIVGELGNLKQIRRISSQEVTSTSGFGYSNQGISTEWYEADDETSLYRYEDGKVVKIENWKDDELIRTKTFRYTDSGRVVIESDLLTDVVTRQLYDLDEKLLLDEIKDGSSIIKNTYIYEDDLLVEQILASPGIRRKHLFYYNSEGSLKSERIIKDDILIKEIFYNLEKKEIVKVYRDNSLILVVYYENGEKIREERIQ